MKQFLINFKKQKTVSFLNIFSLALGITIFILVVLWLAQELNFDTFHKNKDRIYRASYSSSVGECGVFYMPFGQLAKDEIPTIEDMCRIAAFQDGALQIDRIWTSAIPVILADPNFFSFFSFPLLGDTPDNIFSSKDKAVISKSAITKYFPDNDPIGKSVTWGPQTFIISGIMEDQPNSSIQGDFIFPFFAYYDVNSWSVNLEYMTFFIPHKGIDPHSLIRPLQEILYNGKDDYRQDRTTITLSPLSELHFSSHIARDGYIKKGSKSLIFSLALIALIILVISCINFINLFISTSFIRARSVGIKKALGAGSFALIKEVYTETSYYVIISILLGIFFALLALPLFNNFVSSDLQIDFTSPQLYLFLVCLFIITVLLAGSLPAFYLTKFNPTETISGKFKGKKISFFQKNLIIVQISCAISLLIVVCFMQKQINYMISKDLGFNKENIIYTQVGPLSETFRNEKLKSNHIVDICTKNTMMTNWEKEGIISNVSTMDDPATVELCRVSPNYFDFFDIKFIDGETPFTNHSADNFVVVNEKFIKKLGISQPLDHPIYEEKKQFIIKGVIEDIYTRSFHQEVDPQVYLPIQKFGEGGEGIGTVFFKIQGHPQEAIKDIEKDWNKYIDYFIPGYSFEYRFLDETYEQLYKSEINTGKILYFTTFIAFIIAGAGLFAIVYYSIQRRTREIALRKVHGASVESLFFLLNKDILIWLGIAFTIACIISVYALHLWLNNYVVRTSLSIWVFLLIGLGVLVFAVLTVGYQILKMTIRNPVESLKED